MSLKRYRARIKLPIGTQEVSIEADSLFNAKQMLEAQYGVGSVFWGPIETLHD